MARYSKEIQVITETDWMETLLTSYREVIGRDFEGYRNHCYRVLSYINHFLDGDTSDRRLIETALVFHDIALWTDRELAYLTPSADLAEAENERNGWGLDTIALRAMIDAHHKWTSYRGPHARLVNAFRKADWIDATNGLVRNGMPRACVRTVKKALPTKDFYQSLQRLGPELTNWKLLTMFGKFAKVYKW